MDSMWSIGLGFVLFNIVLVILLNIVSNYIYDRVPIKAVVSVSIVITGTLGIIWGLWTDKIPMLLGINLIVAMVMWILLTSIKKKFQKVQISFRTIISVIIAITSNMTVGWKMGVGEVSILSGMTWIFLMMIWVVLNGIIDFLFSVSRTVSGFFTVFEEFLAIRKASLTRQGEIDRGFQEVVQQLTGIVQQLTEVQVDGVSLLVEEIAKLQGELDHNKEFLSKNEEELNNFKEQLSKTVKIPEWMQKFPK